MSEMLAQQRAMSLVELVMSWGRNPKVAAARSTPSARRVQSYNLRCRFGQSSTFDVAMMVKPDGVTAHLKKTTFEKIDQDVPLATLAEIATNGQADWVVLRLDDRDVSIKRRCLRNAIKVLLAPH